MRILHFVVALLLVVLVCADDNTDGGKQHNDVLLERIAKLESSLEKIAGVVGTIASAAEDIKGHNVQGAVSKVETLAQESVAGHKATHKATSDIASELERLRSGQSSQFQSLNQLVEGLSGGNDLSDVRKILGDITSQQGSHGDSLASLVSEMNSLKERHDKLSQDLLEVCKSEKSVGIVAWVLTGVSTVYNGILDVLGSFGVPGRQILDAAWALVQKGATALKPLLYKVEAVYEFLMEKLQPARTYMQDKLGLSSEHALLISSISIFGVSTVLVATMARGVLKSLFNSDDDDEEEDEPKPATRSRKSKRGKAKKKPAPMEESESEEEEEEEPAPQKSRRRGRRGSVSR